MVMSGHELLEPTSRVDFGMTWPVHFNVRVHDIGKLDERLLPKLLRYVAEAGS